MYLDTSVIVPLFVEQASTHAVQDVLLPFAGELIVSDLAAAEFSAVISCMARTKERSEAEARLLLDRFDRWRAAAGIAQALNATDLLEADRLVRRFELKLRAPDALHLVLCRRSGAPLATTDVQMARAAERLGLPLTPLPT